jgi:hypothetical protein
LGGTIQIPFATTASPRVHPVGPDTFPTIPQNSSWVAPSAYFNAIQIAGGTVRIVLSLATCVDTIHSMDTELSPEISVALRASKSNSLLVVDPVTNRRYVIIDAEEFARLEDANAIRQGISQMEAGLGQPLDEAMNEVRSLLRQRQ